MTLNQKLKRLAKIEAEAAALRREIKREAADYYRQKHGIIVPPRIEQLMQGVA